MFTSLFRRVTLVLHGYVPVSPPRVVVPFAVLCPAVSGCPVVFFPVFPAPVPVVVCPVDQADLLLREEVVAGLPAVAAAGPSGCFPAVAVEVVAVSWEEGPKSAPGNPSNTPVPHRSFPGFPV